MNEPSLDPPDAPEPDEDCAECVKPLDDEAYEIDTPGRRNRWTHAVWVCSWECKNEYLNGWADSVLDIG